MMKRCTKCKKSKSATFEFFQPRKSAKDGLNTQCRVCKKTPARKYMTPEEKRKGYLESQIKYRYGLTLEQRKQMYIEQNGCCACCSVPVGYDKICTDHNHKTNQVRGLLCYGCNTLVGWVEHENYKKALDYLKGKS